MERVDPIRSPVETTAYAIRALIGSRSGPASREIARERLRSCLYSFIDHHPGAETCVTDAGSHYADFWNLKGTAASTESPVLHFSNRAAMLQAQTLVEVAPVTDSVLLAVSVAYVQAERESAASILSRGIELLGVRGYATALLLWKALLQQDAGDTASAISTYSRASRSANSAIRRSALASGALVAADHASPKEYKWFADRLDDEEPAHQSEVLTRVAALRSKRIGTARVRSSVDWMRRQRAAEHGDQAWLNRLVSQ